MYRCKGAVFNSRALMHYGIDASTETPAGGVIVRKPGSNEPRGPIMETAFMTVFEQTVSPPTRLRIAMSR